MYFNLNQILCILLIIILCIIVYFKFLKEPFNFTNINSETTHAGTTVAGTTVAGTTVAGTTVAGQETTQAGTTVAGQETTQAGTTVAGQETTQAGTTNAGSTTSSNSLNNHIKNRIGLYLNVNEGTLQIQLQHSNGTLVDSSHELKFKSFVELRNWWNSSDDDTVKFYYQPDNQQPNYGFGYKKLYKKDTTQLNEFIKQYNYLKKHHGHYHTHTTQTGISNNNNGTQVIWSKKGKYWPHIHASDGFDPWYKPFEAQNSNVPTQNNAHH